MHARGVRRHRDQSYDGFMAKTDDSGYLGGHVEVSFRGAKKVNDLAFEDEEGEVQSYYQEDMPYAEGYLYSD